MFLPPELAQQPQKQTFKEEKSMLKLVWNLKEPQIAIVILEKFKDSHLLTKLLQSTVIKST